MPRHLHDARWRRAAEDRHRTELLPQCADRRVARADLVDRFSTPQPASADQKDGPLPLKYVKLPVSGLRERTNSDKFRNNHFSQPRLFYNSLSDVEKCARPRSAPLTLQGPLHRRRAVRVRPLLRPHRPHPHPAALQRGRPQSRGQDRRGLRHRGARAVGQARRQRRPQIGLPLAAQRAQLVPAARQEGRHLRGALYGFMLG